MTPALESLKAAAEAAYLDRLNRLRAAKDRDERMAVIAAFKPVRCGELGFSCVIPENRSAYRRQHLRTTCYLGKRRVSDDEARAYLASMGGSS